MDSAYSVCAGIAVSLCPGRSAVVQEPAAAAGADSLNDHRDNQAQENQGAQEDQERHGDAVIANRHRFRRMHHPEHSHHVSAYRDVFAQPDHAEKAYEVIADLGLVLGCDLAEKVHHIVVGLAGKMDVSEEDNHVASNFTLDLYAAKEADSVMHGGAWSHADIRKELDRIAVGVGWSGGCRKSGADHAQGKDSTDHGGPHSEYYAKTGRTVP